MAWQNPKTDWAVNPKNPVPEDFNRIEGNIDFLKGDIETKKGEIVTAINDMNQPAEITDTHAELAGKIRDISKDATAAVGDVEKGKTFYAGGQKRTGALALTGTAGTGDVLSGKTFYNTDLKTKRTGTMPNRGAVVITPGTSNKAIVAGYHNGNGYVKGDANLKAENIVKGKSIFGVEGDYQGIKLELADPNIGAEFPFGTQVVGDVEFSPSNNFIAVSQPYHYAGEYINIYRYDGQDGYIKTDSFKVDDYPNETWAYIVNVSWISDTRLVIFATNRVLEATLNSLGVVINVETKYTPPSGEIWVGKVSPDRSYMMLSTISATSKYIFALRLTYTSIQLTEGLSAYAVHFSKDSNLVALVGNDAEKFKLYNRAQNGFTNVPIDFFSVYRPCNVCFSPIVLNDRVYVVITDSRYIKFGYLYDGTFTLVNQSDFPALDSFTENNEQDIEISPDGRYLLMTHRGTNANERVMLYRIEDYGTGQMTRISLPQTHGYGTRVSWNTYGNKFAAGTKAGGTFVYNLINT